MPPGYQRVACAAFAADLYEYRVTRTWALSAINSMHEGKPSEPASYAKQFGVEAPSWPLDVSAVQYAPMNQLRGPNSLAYS
jgi:hypothetical protein